MYAEISPKCTFFIMLLIIAFIFLSFVFASILVRFLMLKKLYADIKLFEDLSFYQVSQNYRKYTTISITLSNGRAIKYYYPKENYKAYEKKIKAIHANYQKMYDRITLFKLHSYD